ncbi:hypothetical protein GCM10011578_096300 [Streptomyces fuscichromogenes]|uniref:Transposase Helix-turn-helix domain-containing protein n=1 Tax=Streptomyces fuscichromogenes TaxID=1324013 RepID=A0A918CXL0_9ACTN|nr:hypothetical protein GCM10011578_096300 [Streptomyces fuscichromogenes]
MRHCAFSNLTERSGSWAGRVVKPLTEAFSTKVKSLPVASCVFLPVRAGFAPCFLTTPLWEHRRVQGTRRRLNTGRQTLLTLAHLRNGHPYPQLATGFGTTTAYRYVTEAVDPPGLTRPGPGRGSPDGFGKGIRPAERHPPAH